MFAFYDACINHRPQPMEPSFSPALPALRAQFEEIVDEVVAPRGAAVDAGLTGLKVPARLGGHGGGLGELLMATELIGTACPSSALCFGMHCVGTAVIAAEATAWQEAHYLRPIAAGRHLTALVLSESGSGAHFYLPSTTLTPDGDGFRVDGVKQFVTNGGHADSYVISPLASDADTGDFSCLVVDAGTPGVEWMAPWEGFGMRDNSSRGKRLHGARCRAGCLLGLPLL
jgi:isovaleryl-CoA dehydrogenase